LKKILLYSA